MLIRLFACDEDLVKVVDQIAGNRLFYHVIDSASAATRIVKALNRRGSPGTYFFLPRDTIRPEARALNIPKHLLGDDAFPLLSKLSGYEERNECILKYVFGNTMVCRSPDVAKMIAHKYQVDCITLDGDKYERKGVISGGYRDPRRNKMVAFYNTLEAGEALDSAKMNLEDAKVTLNQKEVELRTIERKITENETKLMKNDRSLSKMKNEKKQVQTERNHLFSKQLDLEKAVSATNTTIKQLEATCQSLRMELEEDLHSQLTSNERDSFRTVAKKREEVKKSFKERMEKLNLIETKKNNLANDILESEINIEELRVKKDLFKDNEASRKNLELLIKQESESINNALAERNNLADQEVEKSKSIEELKETISRNEREISILSEKLNTENSEQEKLLMKKSQLSKNISNLNAKLHDLASPDPTIASKLGDDSRSSLMKLLKKVKFALKKYENVNQKALDHLDSEEELESLQNRLDGLLKDKDRILNLIEALDDMRAEQINYTFKQMIKYFSNIFSKIIPGGKGDLILTANESEEFDNDVQRTFNAKGVEISVSFTGNGVMKSMSQLSGGQKSIVALTFILSLQRCDPAPFYLFDEVDAALDVEHRAAIASLIKEQAGSAQFIATTFRGELLERADKYFGVLFRGMSSHIKEIVKDEAADFIVESDIQN